MKRISAVLISLVLLASCSVVEGKKSAKKGGDLNVGLVGHLEADPAKATRFSDAFLLDALYARLTRVSANGEVNPWVAKSWRVTKNRLHWIFYINPNARFSNGRHIRAVDVKKSIENVQSSASSSSAAAVLELVRGFSEFHDAGKTKTMSGIKVRGTYRVDFFLDEPWADLPTALAAPAFGIRPATNRTGITSSGLRFSVRNDKQWVLEPIKQSDYFLDRIKITKYAKTNDLAQAVKDKKEKIAIYDVNPPANESVDRVPVAATLFYGMNIHADSLRKERFRKAIIAAIDSSEVVQTSLSNTLVSRDGVIPSGIFGQSESQGCGKTCKYSQDQARKLVKSAYPKGKSPLIHIDIDDSAIQSKIAKKLAADLKEVGIRSKIRSHRFAAYQGFLQSGDQEIFQLGRIAEYNSIDAVVWPLFASGSADNAIGLSDPKIDKAIASARKTSDAAKRAEKLADVEHDALSKGTVIPIAQINVSLGHDGSVQKFDMNAFGTVDLRRVWVE